MNTEKFKIPTKGKILYSLIIVAVGLLPFLLNPPALPNYIVKNDFFTYLISIAKIYDGQLFRTDITYKVMLEYSKLLIFLLTIAASLMIIFYLTRERIDYQKYLSDIKVNNRNITINFLLVFFV